MTGAEANLLEKTSRSSVAARSSIVADATSPSCVWPEIGSAYLPFSHTDGSSRPAPREPIIEAAILVSCAVRGPRTLISWLRAGSDKPEHCAMDGS
jgi:hypothetical protein